MQDQGGVVGGGLYTGSGSAPSSRSSTSVSFSVMLHRLTLRSPIASSSRSVSGDSIEAAWTFLATTTSPLLGSHAQVLGGVDAADAGTAEAVPRAAGVFTWTKLCARCCPDSAAVPSEARTAAAAVVSPSGTGTAETTAAV